MNETTGPNTESISNVMDMQGLVGVKMAKEQQRRKLLSEFSEKYNISLNRLTPENYLTFTTYLPEEVQSILVEDLYINPEHLVTNMENEFTRVQDESTVTFVSWDHLDDVSRAQFSQWMENIQDKQNTVIGVEFPLKYKELSNYS